MTARKRPGLTWVVVLSVIEMIAVAAGAGPPVQPLLSVLFVLTCPGFLLIDLRNPRDPVARVMLGIGGSLAINASLVTVSLVGDIRPVAPVLVFALAFVALLPRATLRRGINSIKSLVGRADVGQETAATSAAEDRLTPVYVTHETTANGEPDTGPLEEDSPPLIDHEEEVEEPVAAEEDDIAPAEELPVVEEEDVPALADDHPSEDVELVADTSEVDADDAATPDEEPTEVDEQDLPPDPEDAELIAPLSDDATEPHDKDLVATPEQELPVVEEEDVPALADDHPSEDVELVADTSEVDADDAATPDEEPTEVDEQDLPPDPEDAELITTPEEPAPADAAEVPPALEDADFIEEAAEAMAATGTPEAADLELITPLVDDATEVDDEDLPEVVTEDDVVALLEELRAADDDFEAESVGELAAEDSVDLEALPEGDDAELDKDAGPSSPVPVPAADDRSEEEVHVAAPEPQDKTPDSIVADTASVPPASPLPTEDTIEMPPAAVVVFGVDINHAGVESIAAFPGMKPEPAGLIVAYRDRHGPFRDARALLNLMRAIDAREKAKGR